MLNAAGVHDVDLVGQGEGFVLVVGDEDGGGAFLLEDGAHFEREAFAQVNVEVGEGLVEQEELWPGRQRAGERDALLLAAGEFVRVFFAAAGEADGGEQGADPRRAFGGGLGGDAEGDVAGDREVREERVILEDHADLARLGRQAEAGVGDALPAEADFACGDRLEAGDAAQERGLAAARGAEQAGDLAARDGKIDAVDNGVRAVTLDDAAQFEEQGVASLAGVGFQIGGGNVYVGFHVSGRCALCGAGPVSCATEACAAPL